MTEKSVKIEWLKLVIVAVSVAFIVAILLKFLK